MKAQEIRDKFGSDFLARIETVNHSYIIQIYHISDDFLHGMETMSVVDEGNDILIDIDKIE